MVVLKRVGVLKAACFLGLYGVFIGLIFGLIGIILSNVIRSLSAFGGAGILSLFGIGTWLAVLLVPLVYGVLFFLMGLIFTPLMNLILKIIKGLDLDMVE